eukprot:3137750-Lingulodinium_polyedra.AAC.1
MRPPLRLRRMPPEAAAGPAQTLVLPLLLHDEDLLALRDGVLALVAVLHELPSSTMAKLRCLAASAAATSHP